MPVDQPPPPAWAAHLPAGTGPSEVARLGSSNLTGRWAQHWASDPVQQLLFDDRSGWVSAGEFEERTRCVAGRYRAAGLAPGDRLLVSAPSSVDLAVACVAALRLGLVVVPVNTGYREREVAHVVTDASPAAALVHDREQAAWVAGAAGPIPVFGPEVDLVDGPADDLDVAAADDPALLLYTSGTTGPAKGAPLSHRNLLASAEAVGLAWRWTPEDRLVLALPLFHLHGLGVGLVGTLTAGASAVLQPAFHADDLLDAVDSHRASLFFGVPTMYARLAASPRLSGLGGLRLCVSGSAPLPVALHGAVAEGAGLRVLERYGMTETVMNVSNPYVGERRPGTVGFPLPGVELRLDHDTGEILLRGPNVFAGYWHRPDATAESFVDGWFRTGDVGAIDDDGYVAIVGRRKELIISGGYNVYPREVEDVLRMHPGVVDVAVVGAPDPEWGETVVAHIEGDVVEAEVLAFARSRLAPHKRPKRIRRSDALPRNALGKVVKGELPDG